MPERERCRVSERVGGRCLYGTPGCILAHQFEHDGFVPLSLRDSIVAAWLWRHTPIKYRAARAIARLLP